MDYPVWKEIGQTLQISYPQLYITPEVYGADNFFQAFTITPDVTTNDNGEFAFFGTKVNTIFVVSLPYGWEFDTDAGEWIDNWPPLGLYDLVAKHIATYDNYASYKVGVYVDFYFVQKIEENDSNSRIRDMMEAVDGHMIELCSELADYGWTYLGRITTAPDAALLLPEVQSFFRLTTNP